MGDAKDARLLWLRFHLADGSTVRIDHPEQVRLTAVHPFDVGQPVAKVSSVPRLGLGRFLRAKSLQGLVRSLVRATEGWPQSECRGLCRQLAARICARGPSAVAVLLGRGDSDEDSVYARLVSAFTGQRMMALASVPPSPRPSRFADIRNTTFSLLPEDGRSPAKMLGRSLSDSTSSPSVRSKRFRMRNGPPYCSRDSDCPPGWPSVTRRRSRRRTAHSRSLRGCGSTGTAGRGACAA